MQQKVVGFAGVAVPVGTPPCAAQVPPLTGPKTAARLAMLGFAARFTQSAAALVGFRVATAVVQVSGEAAEYSVTVAEQLAPLGSRKCSRSSFGRD